MKQSPLHIVMTAAHGGYDSDKQPLGGGAAICERLCALWAGREDIALTLLGSGPHAPDGVDYHAFPPAQGHLPSSLNEWDYARFARDFEKATTEYVLNLPEPPVVISHDISEGPNFRRLALAGVRCIPIFHVDVVDYFNRFYLGDLISASWWTAFHRSWRSLMPIPDVLQLVFEKQMYAVEHCPYVVVPSPPMEGVLRKCYPQLPQGRVQVLPWGAPIAQPDPAEVEEAKAALLREWGLEARNPLLLTLSRISPEKNQVLLLEALRCGEEEATIPSGLTLVISGEAAYMRGQSYRRKLEIMAGRLRRTRVIFSGHMGGARKRAVFELADLFIVPSRHESYGLTTMEAMASGLPVVGLATYGVEATVSSDCGILVAPGGQNLPAALWKNILGLLKDDAERQRLREGALQRAGQATFSLAAEGLLALARQLSARPLLA